MRIPKRVNAVLDWAERNFGALAMVVALVVAAVAVLAAPPAVGYPAAAFILGLAVGGFVSHLRMAKRVARARAEIDDLLRQNGALRHRNTVLASGVITRESQTTQALLAIPEDDGPLKIDPDPQRTEQLPQLPDDA
ncbi:hypothetical protein [Actinomadura hibisca]|uniref:hypothetical protein n=1 Tax=Actinomadura hibisca TaxID=68565 RepID=UPI000B0AFF7E|nr:hypothetical protein [Actinomadura hibisca]